MRIITVNYQKLVDALTKMDEANPRRTKGELNLLMDNITNHLSQFIEDGVLTIKMDDHAGLVYVGGELITDDVYTLPWPSQWGKEPSTSEKMCRQIWHSLDEAKSYGIYEDVFGGKKETSNTDSGRQPEDESLLTPKHPQDTISEGLQNFIDSMVEEIVLEGKPFDTQKKYLKKFSENEGLDYEKLEDDIITFIEILDCLKTAFSKLHVKLAEEKGRECYISEMMVEKLLKSSKEASNMPPKKEVIPCEPVPSKQNDKCGTNRSAIDFKVNGVEFKMVKVEGGTFQMGSNDNEAESDEHPIHTVAVSSFYMGETEVTQALWKALMEINPSSIKGDNLPVVDVDWYDAVCFCNKLSEICGKTPCYKIEKNREAPNNNSQNIDKKKWLVQLVAGANGFRLPTEAEWEYAARGGENGKGFKYSGSNNIEVIAWYKGNSRERLKRKPHPVKMKEGNELGLFDMSGNVWEWCEDWHGNYEGGMLSNPKGAMKGTARVLRGGSWCNEARVCRVTSRTCRWPSFGSETVGFRIVC